jgi:hypothetical protein
VQNSVGICIYSDITCRNKPQYYIITNLQFLLAFLYGWKYMREVILKKFSFNFGTLIPLCRPGMAMHKQLLLN